MHLRRALAAIIGLTWACCAVRAQVDGIGPPAAGLVHDAASRTLRPMMGVPGAAYLGEALAERVDLAWPAPNGEWALISVEGRAALLCGSAGPHRAGDYDERIAEMQQAAWSGDSSTAVVYSGADAQIWRVQVRACRMSSAPVLSLAHMGRPSAIALSPDGSRIAFAIDGMGIYTFKTGEAPRPVAETGRVPALAFSEDGGKLYGLDVTARTIVEASGLDSQPGTTRHIAEDVEGIGLVSRHGKLYAATAEAIRIYDGAGALVSEIPLERSPSSMQPVRGGDLFLLNGVEGPKLPVMVLDLSQVPRVFFIPVPDPGSL